MAHQSGKAHRRHVRLRVSRLYIAFVLVSVASFALLNYFRNSWQVRLEETTLHPLRCTFLRLVLNHRILFHNLTNLNVFQDSKPNTDARVYRALHSDSHKFVEHTRIFDQEIYIAMHDAIELILCNVNPITNCIDRLIETIS